MNDAGSDLKQAPAGGVPWWRYLIWGVVGRNPRFTAVRVVVYVVLAWAVFGHLLRPMRVAGVSMEPTYRLGQVNFINKLAYLRSGPGRGDVVGIRMAGESVLFLKRVVGLPGERIRFERGQLYVNDEPLREDYVKHRAPWTEPELQLGPDEYFLVGDNRGMRSRDHEHGAVRRSKIVGRILL